MNHNAALPCRIICGGGMGGRANMGVAGNINKCGDKGCLAP